MIVVLILAPLVRKMHQKNALEAQDFVVAGFAMGGAIALSKVGIKVIIDTKLQTELDWDGTIALCISCALGIYFSFKEVIKLF